MFNRLTTLKFMVNLR